MSRSVVYLVRHAKAGERRTWQGDDLERPLSKAGWKQAHALGKRLQKKGATEMVSSPYLRCMQTLEPLASALDLPVLADERLLEGAGFEGALELLAEVADGAVLCSHGDVIPETLDALVRRGMQVKTTAGLAQGNGVGAQAQRGQDHHRHRLAAAVLNVPDRLASDPDALVSSAAARMSAANASIRSATSLGGLLASHVST